MSLNPNMPPGAISELRGLANRLSDIDRRIKTLEQAANAPAVDGSAPYSMGESTLTFSAQPVNEAWVSHNLNDFPTVLVEVDAANSLFWNIQYIGVVGYPDGNTVRLGFEGLGGASVTGSVHFRWIAFRRK